MQELKDLKAFFEIGPKSLQELQRNHNGHKKIRYPRYYKHMMKKVGREMRYG